MRDATNKTIVIDGIEYKLEMKMQNYMKKEHRKRVQKYGWDKYRDGAE